MRDIFFNYVSQMQCFLDMNQINLKDMLGISKCYWDPKLRLRHAVRFYQLSSLEAVGTTQDVDRYIGLLGN
jgi:hypothetical protein